MANNLHNPLSKQRSNLKNQKIQMKELTEPPKNNKASSWIQLILNMSLLFLSMPRWWRSDIRFMNERHDSSLPVPPATSRCFIPGNGLNFETNLEKKKKEEKKNTHNKSNINMIYNPFKWQNLKEFTTKQPTCPSIIYVARQSSSHSLGHSLKQH